MVASQGFFDQVTEFKQCFEYFRIAAVHRFGKRGFCHCFHSEMIKSFVVGKQSSFNFTQRILAGNLSKQQSQKLFPFIKSLHPAIEGRVIFLSSKRHKIGNIIIFLLVIAIYCGILGVLRQCRVVSLRYNRGFFDNRYISANVSETDQVEIHVCVKIR